MEFKPDFEQVKFEFCAFWQNENHKRALIAVTAPLDDGKGYERLYDINRFNDNDYQSITHWWCDPDENVKRHEYIFKHTYYGGEALPIAFCNWGAMVLCAFYGSTPIFNKKSVWYNKVIIDWDSWSFNFDKNRNQYYKTMVEITNAFVKHGKGRYFAGMPELGSAGDVLSLMRGMDSMCLDIYDCPDRLKASIDYITCSFLCLQDELYSIIKPTGGGGSTLAWMSLWMPGKNGNQLACDFSWVISNADFKKFFMDELLAEATWSDFPVYHLDGPMCMKNHLDLLLEIPKIKAIQWTPGAGSPPASTKGYLPIYRKILQSGKRLILIAEPHEVDLLTKELPPQGLFIKTTAHDKQQADALIKSAEENAAMWRSKIY